MLVIIVPLGTQVRLPPSPPRAHRRVHTPTYAQRRVLTPEGGAQGSSDPKATPEPVEKLPGPQLPSFFLNSL